MRFQVVLSEAFLVEIGKHWYHFIWSLRDFIWKVMYIILVFPQPQIQERLTQIGTAAEKDYYDEWRASITKDKNLN